MIQVRASLQRLASDIVELHETLLSRQIDPGPYLRQLDRTVQSLEVKYETVVSPKPPLDAEETWARWRAANYDLTGLDAREVRTLCTSPKTAMRTRLVDVLCSSPGPLMRWTNFNGFVQAYFAHWRTMDEPHVVEGLIQEILDGRIRRNSKMLGVWRRSLFLFSAEASRRIGEVIIRDRKSVKQACAEYFIESTATMAVEAHVQAAAIAVKELVQRDVRVGQETALTELQWITENLLTKALGSEGYRSAMSTLIVSRLAEGMPLFQSALVNRVHDDERLGDPRLASCAQNWRSMPQEAKDKFLAWLAKDTLQFFFDTLVPKNDTNRRRAEFWLEYAKKQGKIKDFQVAVSEDDRYRIRASRAKTVPSYSAISGGKTSAFLMVFEGYGTDYVVIEFSETGNAAYIYSRSGFEQSGVTLRSLTFRLSEDLKRMRVAEDRILHISESRVPWETKARRKLAELGIRP